MSLEVVRPGINQPKLARSEGGREREEAATDEHSLELPEVGGPEHTEREQQLLREIVTGKKAGRDVTPLRHELFEMNKGYPVTLAVHFWKARCEVAPDDTVPFQEILQASRKGLWIATNAARPDKGRRFVSFAGWYCKNEMRLTYLSLTLGRQIDSARQRFFSALDDLDTESRQRNGRPVREEEVLDAFSGGESSPAAISTMYAEVTMPDRCSSLTLDPSRLDLTGNGSIRKSNNGLLTDQTVCDNALNPQEQFELQEAADIVNAFLKSFSSELTSRQEIVVRLLLGFPTKGWEERPHTRRELAEYFDVSQEAIRQQYRKAESRLKELGARNPELLEALAIYRQYREKEIPSIRYIRERAKKE